VHGAGTVTLTALARADAVELHVRDEGPGFPAGFAPRAFDRFSRADEARPRPGSGLGLAIVETIARSHGGSAGLAPASAGTDVWISLPAGDVPAPDRGPRRAARAAA
jgi:signal transduction histidine kinase